jgi:hypothetical protein
MMLVRNTRARGGGGGDSCGRWYSGMRAGVRDANLRKMKSYVSASFLLFVR